VRKLHFFAWFVTQKWVPAFFGGILLNGIYYQWVAEAAPGTEICVPVLMKEV